MSKHTRMHRTYPWTQSGLQMYPNVSPFLLVKLASALDSNVQGIFCNSFLPADNLIYILGVLLFDHNWAALYVTENPLHEVPALRPNGLLPPVSRFCWKFRKSTKFMGTARTKQPNLSFPVFDIFFILLLHTTWLQMRRGLKQRLEPTAGWPRSKSAQVFSTFFNVRSVSLICLSETMLNKFAFQQLLQSS